MVLGSKTHRHGLGQKALSVAKKVGKGVVVVGGIVGLAAAATGGGSDVKVVPRHSDTWNTLRGR